MKIENPNLAGSPAATGQAQPAEALRAYTGSQGTERGAAGDRVELSRLGGSVAAALAADSRARASRVASLAGRFQSGTYAADALGSSRALVAETLAARGTDKAAGK